MKPTPITAGGARRLREELDQLKRVERPRITRAVAEARAHGDLKENAEYHAAREEQSFLEGRIAMLETALATARIIDAASVEAAGRVIFGSTVELEQLEEGHRMHFQIVGEVEADISAGRLSLTSPIAKAIISHEEGDTVEVKAPNGTTTYEIISIHYGS